MYTYIHLLVIIIFSLDYSSVLRAEDSVDPQTKIKHLKTDLVSIKDQVVDAQALLGDDWMRISLYKSCIEKLLEMVRNGQTLSQTKESVSKIDKEKNDGICKIHEFYELVLREGVPILTPTPLHAEDSVDPQAQLKHISAEIAAVKIQLEDVITKRTESEKSLAIYASFYENLLNSVQTEQTLVKIREVTSKVEDSAKPDIVRIENALRQYLKKKSE